MPLKEKNENAYTLKERKYTQELHLFKGIFTANSCKSNFISICEKMNKNENQRNIFQCLDENESRVECARIGRNVCGICVSHLYTTYDE